VTIHLKIKLQGTHENLSRFHAMAKSIDRDWPLCVKVDDALPSQCPKCHGYIYQQPLLTVEDLYLLAKQAQLHRIKVKRYQPEEICEGE
jgi:hypothetical protein